MRLNIRSKMNLIDELQDYSSKLNYSMLYRIIKLYYELLTTEIDIKTVRVYNRILRVQQS